MKTKTPRAAISTGFRSHHCFAPAALITTSSEPWFIELNVKMTASRRAIGAVTVVSEGRRSSVIWKKVTMVWPIAETRSNWRSAWVSHTVIVSAAKLSRKARTIFWRM